MKNQEKYFANRTGQGVRVAVVDSGVNAQHPHVAGVAGGIALRSDGSQDGDYLDRLGHGTAVTAAIREKAPGAEIYAVKVFDRVLSADIQLLVRAIDWAARNEIRLVNLSLGTARPDHAEALREAVRRAGEHGAIVVAASENDGIRWLPGSLTGVVPVMLDWACHREEYRVAADIDGTPVFLASGFPRDVPGIPRERNLKGISFAVANMTGFAARALEGSPRASFSELQLLLSSGAAHPRTGQT